MQKYKNIITTLILCVLSVAALKANTATQPERNCSKKLTAFLISDSLIYLTPKGAKEVLRNYEAKKLCEEISNEKQEIINKMHLKNAIVLEEKQRAEKQAFEANEALKATRKKLLRANVERYAYRFLTIATTIFIVVK